MKVTNFSETFPEIKICSGVFFSDNRGNFKKAIHGEQFSRIMPEVKELLCTTSSKDVVRGLHFQKEPHSISKFLTCVQGEILDVFVDIRKDSKTYGMHGSKILKQGDSESIFIPKGFAHGYSTLSDVSVVVYLQSGDYIPEFDTSINPLSIDIDWKVKSPIISEKDSNAISFENY